MKDCCQSIHIIIISVHMWIYMDACLYICIPYLSIYEVQTFFVWTLLLEIELLDHLILYKQMIDV